MTDYSEPSLGEVLPNTFHRVTCISDEVRRACELRLRIPGGRVASPVDFSFVAEWRDEGYESRPGDEQFHTHCRGTTAFAGSLGVLLMPMSPTAAVA